MDNSFDMRDLLLEATADVQEIVRELLQELSVPMVRAQIKQMWMQMPDEMKEQFKTERPDDYRALMDALQ